MFEKLVFNDNEKLEFDKYMKIKGEFLHQQVYNVLLDIREVVKYSELSSIIRYDKCFRDKLYIYLATFEEKIKSEIFRKFDIQKQDIIYKSYSQLNDLLNDTIEKSHMEHSNLYFCFQLDLGTTINFIEKKKMYSDLILKDLNNIRQLRNKVMHHSLIILDNKTKFKDVKENLDMIKKYIISLCDQLPEDYQKNFIDDINRLKCDVEELKIVLEKKDGICK